MLVPRITGGCVNLLDLQGNCGNNVFVLCVTPIRMILSSDIGC